MRKLRRIFLKHFNCVPWFVVGIQILADGNISRWQYLLCWICTLVLIWVYCPNRIERRRTEVADAADRKKVV